MKFIYMLMISMSIVFTTNANAFDYADDEYIEEMYDMLNIGIRASNKYVDYWNDNYKGTSWRCRDVEDFLDLYGSLNEKYDYAVEKHEAFLDYYQDTSYKAEKKSIRKAKRILDQIEKMQDDVYRVRRELMKGCK